MRTHRSPVWCGEHDPVKSIGCSCSFFSDGAPPRQVQAQPPNSITSLLNTIQMNGGLSALLQRGGITEDKQKRHDGTEKAPQLLQSEEGTRCKQLNLDDETQQQHSKNAALEEGGPEQVNFDDEIQKRYNDASQEGSSKHDEPSHQKQTHDASRMQPNLDDKAQPQKQNREEGSRTQPSFDDDKVARRAAKEQTQNRIEERRPINTNFNDPKQNKNVPEEGKRIQQQKKLNFDDQKRNADQHEAIKNLETVVCEAENEPKTAESTVALITSTVKCEKGKGQGPQQHKRRLVTLPEIDTDDDDNDDELNIFEPCKWDRCKKNETIIGLCQEHVLSYLYTR
jgi:hypothetical protein